MIAFMIVRYKLQTLILELREAFATGAGSPFSTGSGGAISGSTVVSASGSRRVRNRVEAWRYVLEIGDGWREDVVDIAEENRWLPKGSEFPTAMVELPKESRRDMMGGS